jgi:hypothetical protein
MNDKTEIIGLCVLGIAFLYIGWNLGVYYNDEIPMVPQPFTPAYDVTSSVACGSNSMGASVHCGDKLLLTRVKPDQNLTVGKIYIFKQNASLSDTTIHRLVHCFDDNCSTALFMGDANKYADAVVKRENVLYEVRGVYYGN